MVFKAIKILWKKLSEKENIFVKKDSLKKRNKIGQKIFLGNFLKFRNFLRFLSLDILQSYEFCIWNTFDPSAICIQCIVLHNAVTVATLPITITSVLDRTGQSQTRYKSCLHVPYKLELVITWVSIQTSTSSFMIWIIKGFDEGN